MANRLTIKGQVTIPKEIRDFLNLTSGNSLVEFEIGADGSVIVRKAAEREKGSSRVHKEGRHQAGGGFDVLSLLSGVCA